MADNITTADNITSIRTLDPMEAAIAKATEMMKKGR